MITGTGRAWVSANAMRFSSLPSARSTRWVPVRRSSDRKPCTASRPFVVADRARIASASLASVSMAGRPSPAPPSITPLQAASAAISSPGS
ncbi:MAG: hypothetical protein J2P19_18300 [Pseudonocardia sp.]|nr:hypothetical protein [Pseudonocardia sp.]